MLLGRETECTRLGQMLEKARDGTSQVLIVRGEPGVGKTALLRDATSRARALGFKVLWARGIESESELPFAGLSDLLRPIEGTLGAIPLVQAAVLSGALAMGPPVPADRFAACAAFLSLLAAAAEAEPLMVVVDDIQWLDASSVEAILFACRRIGSDEIAVLITVREGEAVLRDASDLPSFQLKGLDEPTAIELLRNSQPPVVPAVARRLYQLTRGNPLALLEIPGLLNEAERHGLEPLPDPLPAGPHLEHAFVRRLRSLPVSTQQALLAAAASESGDIAVLHRALGRLGIPPSALDAAESAGLLTIDGTDLRFRHPLIRSAVYQVADPVARREAHRGLAEALNAEEVADRRAWHLAAAAAAPDEAVAAALEQAATRSIARAGFGSAARALSRAAALSPEPADRGRRLVAAANASQLAGRPDRSLQLLDQAAREWSGERLRSEIEHLRAEIEIWAGTPMRGHDRMLAEARRVTREDPRRAAILMAQAAVPCYMAGQIRLALKTAREASRLAEKAGGPPPLAIDVILAEALALSGLSEEAGSLVTECLRRTLSSGLEAAREAQYLPFSVVALERYQEAELLTRGAVEAARQASAVGILPYGLAILSEIQFRLGDFSAAYATGSESVRLANETGQMSASSYSLVTLARVEAAQGRDADCRGHINDALKLARTHQLGSIFDYVSSALGLLELGQGRPQEALRHLSEAARVTREQGLGEPNVVQFQPDLIETLARVGQHDAAVAELQRLEQDAERTGRLWARATAERCRGLLATDDFASHFQRALGLHRSSATPSPFEIARTQLCFGERLRRNRQRIEAREQLTAALESFERIGAEPWANRARAELSATGEKARKRDVATTRELTPQELQIALAVAAGATNREAAAQLFVSPKTVEAHLSSAYRKLDIRSRTGLVRLLTIERERLMPARSPERVGITTAQ